MYKIRMYISCPASLSMPRDPDNVFDIFLILCRSRSPIVFMNELNCCTAVDPRSQYCKQSTLRTPDPESVWSCESSFMFGQVNSIENALN